MPMIHSKLWSAGTDLFGRVHWQLYLTLTFDPEKLRRRRGRHQFEKEWLALRLLINTLNLKLFKRQAVKRKYQGLVWFAFIEPHKLAGYHFHVLVAGIPQDGLGWTMSFIQSWWRRRMGDPDVQIVDHQRACVAYCCKSIDSGNEWEVSDSFMRVASLPLAA